jgi:hypothetical protein
MKGGFWDTLSKGFSDTWQKTKKATKKATSDAYSSATGSSTPTPAAAPMPTQPDTPMPTQPASPTSSGYMGGRTRRRRMRGGFKDNTPTTGLAAHAASFSGETAQPHNWVGGRTRRRNGRKHRCNKSCRHRR